MAHPEVPNGRDVLQISRVAVNLLNKKSRTADKELSSNLEVGWEASNSLRYET
jgi:hypothetical protein